MDSARNRATGGESKYQSLAESCFSSRFAAFLLAVSAPERIAMDGNASFSKTGSFVETVPISVLAANRKSKPRWAAFSLVRFFVAVDKEMISEPSQKEKYIYDDKSATKPSTHVYDRD